MQGCVIGHNIYTTYGVSVNFLEEWHDLQFRVDSERQIFEKLFMEILFTLRNFANEPTHYRLDYGDSLRNIDFIPKFQIT